MSTWSVSTGASGGKYLLLTSVMHASAGTVTEGVH
jgi:hypothetical protein